MKITLVVARNYREFDDYVRVESDKACKDRRQDFRYVSTPNNLAGYRPDKIECVLLGRYYELHTWPELRAHLMARGIECSEVMDWR